MVSRTAIKEQLRNMSEGEFVTVNWFEEGGGEVELKDGEYLLSEIPQYGGIPQFVGTFTFTELDELINEAYSWS
jgi:hypothetical protein